jgi:hypothetical protein
VATVQSPADYEILRFFGESAFEEWRLFEAHFEAAAGSSVLVLLLPGTAGALVCEQALAERLAKNQRRLERIRFSGASEIIRLGGRLLDLDPRGIGGVWISLLSSERTDEGWMAACAKMFALLNEHRSRIFQSLPVPLIFVGQPWLQQVFLEAAPDFWSARSTVVRLLPQNQPGASGIAAASPQNQPSPAEADAGNDPDSTLQLAHRLANRRDLAFKRAELLMRASTGFHENGRLELAESCGREALDALAEASNIQSQPCLDRPVSDAPEVLIADVPEMKQRPRVYEMRATILNNLATVLQELGHREAALAYAQEAARIYEQLAQTESEAVLPAFAASLNTLANTLGDLGLREAALSKAQKAARLYKQLAQARRDAFLPDLAISLNNLAMRLGDLGRHEESLVEAQEAVWIYTQLAHDRPDAFLPVFAKSLNNLAIRLGDLGLRQVALAKAEEALRIREQLAKARPDAFLPDLATSLNNLAIMLSDLGRRREALDKAREALRINEQLAKARPDSFLPDLATSLNNLAVMLSALGRRRQALAKAQEAVRIYEQLTKLRPDAFEPDCANSLGVKRRCLKAIKDSHGAAQASLEALKVLSPHFLENPAAHSRLMAWLLQNYLKDTEAIQQEPDKNLIGPIQEQLRQLNESQPEE